MDDGKKGQRYIKEDGDRQTRGKEVEKGLEGDITWSKVWEKGRDSEDLGWKFGAKKKEAYIE